MERPVERIIALKICLLYALPRCKDGLLKLLLGLLSSVVARRTFGSKAGSQLSRGIENGIGMVIGTLLMPDISVVLKTHTRI